MHYECFHIILAGLFVLCCTGFLTTYLIAVFNEHVWPAFPYISDTGALPPESCIFGQALNIGAFLIIICVYVRYHHIKTIINTNKSTYGFLTKFNIACYIQGLLIGLGISLVGNFQEQNVVQVHMTGAMLSFGLLIFYLSIQTYLSNRLSFVFPTSRSTLYVRIFLVLISVFFFVICMTFSFVSYAQYKEGDRRRWKPEDPGYAEHVVSTSAEWAMAFAQISCLLTFYNDYRRIKIKFPEVHDSSLNSLVVPTTATEKSVLLRRDSKTERSDSKTVLIM